MKTPRLWWCAQLLPRAKVVSTVKLSLYVVKFCDKAKLTWNKESEQANWYKTLKIGGGANMAV